MTLYSAYLEHRVRDFSLPRASGIVLLTPPAFILRTGFESFDSPEHQGPCFWPDKEQGTAQDQAQRTRNRGQPKTKPRGTRKRGQPKTKLRETRNGKNDHYKRGQWSRGGVAAAPYKNNARSCQIVLDRARSCQASLLNGAASVQKLCQNNKPV